jgi:hypothetical protein
MLNARIICFLLGTVFFIGCQATQKEETIFRGVVLSAKLYRGDGFGVRDLFIEDVPGSKSFWLGPWVTVERDSEPGEFYIVTGYNRFYIQTAAANESTLKFYGPFAGRPQDMFSITAKRESQ